MPGSVYISQVKKFKFCSMNQLKRFKIKKILMISYSMRLFIGFASSQTDKSESNSFKQLIASGLSYTCTMHPEVISGEPGSCPKCRMDLVQKSTVRYTCPMYPELTSLVPGKYPRRGMKLKKDNTPEDQTNIGCCM
jgi:hypothetical protein